MTTLFALILMEAQTLLERTNNWYILMGPTMPSLEGSLSPLTQQSWCEAVKDLSKSWREEWEVGGISPRMQNPTRRTQTISTTTALDPHCPRGPNPSSQACNWQVVGNFSTHHEAKKAGNTGFL